MYIVYIRKAIYTTNTIESINRQIRVIIRTIVNSSEVETRHEEQRL